MQTDEATKLAVAYLLDGDPALRRVWLDVARDVLSAAQLMLVPDSETESEVETRRGLAAWLLAAHLRIAHAAGLSVDGAPHLAGIDWYAISLTTLVEYELGQQTPQG